MGELKKKEQKMSDIKKSEAKGGVVVELGPRIRRFSLFLVGKSTVN